MLTFFAQDHATSDMVYSNAGITKAEQAAEIIAFADYWNNATGSDPGPLVFDSQLTTGKNLFARYAERMMAGNELDAYIGRFYLDALTSGAPLNVDLDTTLTVAAANLYRLLALKLSRYEHATPETLWRDFLDATGTLHIDPADVTCALHLRSHHHAPIDAGFAELETPIPWWDGRTLQFRFPPR